LHRQRAAAPANWPSKKKRMPGMREGERRGGDAAWTNAVALRALVVVLEEARQSCRRTPHRLEVASALSRAVPWCRRSSSRLS
jgi:hypothetical protein